MVDIALSLEAASRQNADGCVKTTEDLARYRAVIMATHPEFIVECGTFSGKSALWFADVAACSVVTIDVNDQVEPHVKAAWDDRVTQLIGSSVTPEIVAEVWALVDGHDAMVVLDSDHSDLHVFMELLAYAPLVRRGGYCVVEDGLVRWMPEQQKPIGPYVGSPLDAIERFLRRHYDWVVDEAVENMAPVTQFPSGWLRRR